MDIREHMANAIGTRVKEVLQFHLKGTPEEFEADLASQLTYALKESSGWD